MKPHIRLHFGYINMPKDRESCWRATVSIGKTIVAWVGWQRSDGQVMAILSRFGNVFPCYEKATAPHQTH